MAFGVHDATLLRLRAGQSGMLWRVRTVDGDAVLKRVHERYSDAQVRLACRTQDFIARDRRLCPPLFRTWSGELFAKKNDGRYYMSPLVTGTPLRSTLSRRTIEQVAELVARMHNALETLSQVNESDGFIAVPAQPLETLELALARARDSRRLSEVLPCLIRKREILRSLLSETDVHVEQLSHQWIHGDVHAANLLRSAEPPSELRVVDFDHVSMFPAIYETLGAFLKVVDPDCAIDDLAELLQCYIGVYAGIRPNRKEDLAAMVDFYLLVHVAETRTFVDDPSTLVGLREFAKQRMRLTEWLHKCRSPLRRAVERALA